MRMPGYVPSEGEIASEMLENPKLSRNQAIEFIIALHDARERGKAHDAELLSESEEDFRTRRNNGYQRLINDLERERRLA